MSKKKYKRNWYKQYYNINKNRIEKCQFCISTPKRRVLHMTVSHTEIQHYTLKYKKPSSQTIELTIAAIINQAGIVLLFHASKKPHNIKS